MWSGFQNEFVLLPYSMKLLDKTIVCLFESVHILFFIACYGAENQNNRYTLLKIQSVNKQKQVAAVTTYYIKCDNMPSY